MHQIDFSERGFGHTRGIQDNDIEFLGTSFGEFSSCGSAFDAESRKLADNGKDIFLHTLKVLLGKAIFFRILHTDIQRALGEVDIENIFCVSGTCSQPYATGIGEEVENAFSGRVCLYPSTCGTKVQKQEWIDSSMNGTGIVLKAEFRCKDFFGDVAKCMMMYLASFFSMIPYHQQLFPQRMKYG